MNIFLYKSLPKRKRIMLEFVRIIFVLTFFGGIFFFRDNQLLSDILISVGVFLATVYTVLKIIADYKNKKLAKEAE